MKAMPSAEHSILLVSCYELGHQPAGIALPLGLLQKAGYRTETMDVSVEGFDEDKAKRARFVGISVPMHTALRLGLRVAEEIRRLKPDIHICFYGLYASLNSEYLLSGVADSVIGGEFEEALLEKITLVLNEIEITSDRLKNTDNHSKPVLARLNFVTPDRSALVPLQHYAKLEYRGEQRLAGYVEASRGCLHLCTHCPIPPVYNGRFFVIPESIVLDDIRGLVALGAQHITFGDPDFLNGPRHSLQIARAVHQEFPDVTFDFTAKIEHLLKHRNLIPEFARGGCIFVVSAVESLSDTVLKHLDKGHTKEDVTEALIILRSAGIAFRPTFVSFTPWGTLDDYIDMLEFIESEGLIDNVDPVQYSIRLLIPPGSMILSAQDSSRWLGPLVQESFSYEWTHPDPTMDELQRQVSGLVEKAVSVNQDTVETFYDILQLAYAVRGGVKERPIPQYANPLRLRPPRLTEAWFC
jgi:radical SAM superfamily enzyme YgiQ (UPF0313 family)